MNRRYILPIFYFPILLMVILLSGCAQKEHVTSFNQPQQQIPETLDMNYAGPKANIAVGDFTVKARGATDLIGDGLREMLQSALFESNRFNILDRLDPKGITAEQQLSYSAMAKKDAPKLGAQMEVAELLFYGTVTEFEAEASGGGLSLGGFMSNIPGTVSAGVKNAHLAIDIRVVDVASGRLVAARRISGSASSYKTTVGTALFDGRVPVSLGAFKNTPMELAIRDCIYRSVIYAATSVPAQYFKH